MKRVYAFRKGKTEGDAAMRKLLGGKGANLAEMTRIGVPVPPGFTITTEACLEFYQKDEGLRQDLKEEVLKNLNAIEEDLPGPKHKRTFGGFYVHRLIFIIDFQSRTAHNAGFSHTPSHDCRVRRHAAASG